MGRVKRSWEQPRFASVVSLLALFVALGGTTYAATRIDSGDVQNNSLLGKDIHKSTLRSSDLRNGDVRAADIASGAVGTIDVLDNSLTGVDIDEYQLGFKVAWARMGINRELLGYYNPAGGPPTITKSDPDSNQAVFVQWPGFDMKPGAVILTSEGSGFDFVVAGQPGQQTLSEALTDTDRAQIVTYKNGSPLADGDAVKRTTVAVLSP